MRPLRIAALVLLGGLCAYALHAWAYQPCFCLLGVQSVGGTTMGAAAAMSHQMPIEARTNLTRLGQLEERCPMEVRVYTLKARNQMLLGRNEEALETYEQALAIEPRPEVYYAKGMLLAKMGRLDEAADSFVPSVRYAPTVLDNIDAYSDELAKRVMERVARAEAASR